MNATGSNRKATVVVVDDDADIREALSTILAAHGYDVLVAEHGGHAIEILSSAGDPPDVILLDLMMPVMDGQQFRAAQLSDPAIASVPVVLLSGDDNARRKAAVGATAYCTKPIDLDELLAIVARFCARPPFDRAG